MVKIASIRWANLRSAIVILGSFLGFFTTGFLPLTAQSAVVPNFFQSVQPVANQSSELRQSAIDKGFAEILVKLAGTRDILSQPAIRQALQNPNAYLRTYAYFKDNAGERFIRLAFAGQNIEQYFLQHQIAFWSKDRPRLVSWLGLDDGQVERVIMTRSDKGQYKQIMEEEAARRGLSILWPTMDRQDQSALSVTDIWSLDMNAVTAASARYNGQLLLLGKLRQSPSSVWYGQWGLEYDGRAHWFESDASDFRAMANKLFDTIASELAGRYAVSVSQADTNTILLLVDGIDSLKKYVEATSTLAGLLPVEQVAVSAATPNQLIFGISVRGGLEQLQSVLDVQPYFRAAPDLMAIQPDSSVGPIMLKYRWTGS